MARCQWVILCERAFVEEQSKTVSIVGILETINVMRVPATANPNVRVHTVLPLRFFVVQQWERTNPKIGERVATRTRLIGPDGKQFGDQETVIDLTASIRTRVIGQAFGIPSHKEGLIKCVIEARVRNKWQKAGESEFGIIFQTGPGRKH